MLIPKIQQHSNYRSFIKELYQSNRKQGGIASFRFYAQKLGWPVSYMNEVIAGKKRLTLNRSLELATFLKLDGIDLERLIYMVLLDSDSKKIRDYFSDKLEKDLKTDGYFEVSQNPETLAQHSFLVPEEIFSDISLLALADLIACTKGKIKISEIPKILSSFPELQDHVRLNQKIDTLEKHGIVRRKLKRGKLVGFDYVAKSLEFSIQKETVKHMHQFAENYKRLLCLEHPRGWINSGFVRLPRTKLFEAKKRLLALRNWIISTDQETVINPNTSLEDTLIFQMDLNLISIVDGKYLQIPPLEYWMGELKAPPARKGSAKAKT